MCSSGQVISVNISTEKGTIKRPVAEATVGPDGIAGDGHAGPGIRQVSLLANESIDKFRADTSMAIKPGEFAENLTVSGVDLGAVAILDELQIGPVRLQVSQIGKKCHGEGCAIFQEVGKCIMPKEGIFGRVVQGGPVRPGDKVEVHPRPLKIIIITLSDRAYKGQYEDRSGPEARRIVEEFFGDKRWHVQIERLLLPDEPDQLREQLVASIDAGADIVFTLGGTGVGPRDITPEAVLAVCDKTIPGIMENIRIKFGQAKPAALLSRSVAGMAGTTQIYALPGSVRAVKEYMGEILKTVEHLVFMAHGLDVH